MNLQAVAGITIVDVVISLMITLLCASIIYWTYRLTYQGVLYQASFNISIVMVSLITTMVIMVISNNLILSLGMVGALSIVRFRTAVKDPLDIVFLFWAISVGIVNGVGNFKISLTGSIFFFVIMYLMSKVKITSAPYLLVLKYDLMSEDSVLDTIKTHTRRFRVKTKSVKENVAEMTAEVRLRQGDQNLLAALNDNKMVKESVLLTYSNEIAGI
jgi:uncharacterized membrane protein YhiD involved in acid resistance